MSSTNISYTANQQNGKSQPHSSIYGINVKGFGFAVEQGEQSERFEHLLAVRDLEEQERSRRLAEDREFELDVEKFRISARKEAGLAQEEERTSRLADVAGEGARKLGANKLAASISNDILAPSLKFTNAASGAFTTAKSFGQDLLSQAGDYAYRAANFFGYKKAQTIELAQNIKGQAYEQAHALTEKTTGIAQNLKEQAIGQALNLTEKASEKAQSIKDQAYEQAQTLSEKATGTAQFLAEKASEKTHLLAHSVSVQAQNLGEKVAEQAQSLGEKVIDLGTEVLTFTGAFEFLTKTNLTIMEEAERQWRMTSGLTIERFLNALKVSEMIKKSDLYAPEFEPNRWYATSILEEFERKSRFLEDGSSVANARRVSHLIHLKNIHEQSYHPVAKQMEKVNDIFAKKSNAFKTSALLKNAGLAHSPLGMAAM